MNTVVRLPERSEVDVNDTWDLGSLFPNDDAWGKALDEFEKQIPRYEEFRGKLGESAQSLADCLDFGPGQQRLPGNDDAFPKHRRRCW